MIYLRRLIVALSITLGTSLTATGGGTNTFPTDPEAFTYTPLPSNGSVLVSMSALSPRFEFKTGVSPYAAFRLPELPGRYFIDNVSELDPSTNPAQSHVFYPSVALLSEAFLVMRTTEGAAWRFDLPEFGQTTVAAYRSLVEFDTNGAERYLIVYTQRDAATRALAGAADSGRLTLKITRQAAE